MYEVETQAERRAQCHLTSSALRALTHTHTHTHKKYLNSTNQDRVRKVNYSEVHSEADYCTCP